MYLKLNMNLKSPQIFCVLTWRVLSEITMLLNAILNYSYLFIFCRLLVVGYVDKLANAKLAPAAHQTHFPNDTREETVEPIILVNVIRSFLFFFVNFCWLLKSYVAAGCERSAARRGGTFMLSSFFTCRIQYCWFWNSRFYCISCI